MPGAAMGKRNPVNPTFFLTIEDSHRCPTDDRDASACKRMRRVINQRFINGRHRSRARDKGIKHLARRERRQAILKRALHTADDQESPLIQWRHCESRPPFAQLRADRQPPAVGMPQLNRGRRAERAGHAGNHRQPTIALDDLPVEHRQLRICGRFDPD